MFCIDLQNDFWRSIGDGKYQEMCWIRTRLDILLRCAASLLTSNGGCFLFPAFSVNSVFILWMAFFVDLLRWLSSDFIATICFSPIKRNAGSLTSLFWRWFIGVASPSNESWARTNPQSLNFAVSSQIISGSIDFIDFPAWFTLHSWSAGSAPLFFARSQVAQVMTRVACARGNPVPWWIIVTWPQLLFALFPNVRVNQLQSAAPEPRVKLEWPYIASHITLFSWAVLFNKFIFACFSGNNPLQGNPNVLRTLSHTLLAFPVTTHCKGIPTC